VIQDLLWEVDLLGLRRVTWTAEDSGGWSCTTTSLRRVRGEGTTPLEALESLLRIAWRTA